MALNNSTPLDYRSPNTAPPRELFSVQAFLAAAFVATVLAIDLLFVVPPFEAIFKDFGTVLPAPTTWLLAASRFAARGGWVILIVFPVIAGFLGALRRARVPAADVQSERRGWLRRMSLLGLLVLLAVSAIVVVTMIALFLPMISLIQAVSGG